MKADDLRMLAEMERRLASTIKAHHPHYFMDDDPAAWTACKASELRAEALDRLAVSAEANAQYEEITWR